MKTNSNSYTIIYSAVLVLVVAFLLAFVFQALKPMQDANVQLDQQKQILFALNQDRDMTDAQAVELWKKIIVADDVIDADGKVVETGRPGGVDAGFRENRCSTTYPDFWGGTKCAGNILYRYACGTSFKSSADIRQTI